MHSYTQDLGIVGEGIGSKAWEREGHGECRDQIQFLQAQVEALQATIREIQAALGRAHDRIEQLEARLKQNSQNSSRPPSSDSPSQKLARAPKPPTGRMPGGQPGHPAHMRKAVPASQVDQVIPVKPEKCRKCGRKLRGEDPRPDRVQVFELPPIEPIVTEFEHHTLTCSGCGEENRAELPPEASGGMLGPRFQALVAYLKGMAHMSDRPLERMLWDVFSLEVSLGTVSNAQERMSEALEKPVQEAVAWVQQQTVANADETGWKQGRDKAWLWVMATSLVTVFLIHAKRGAVAARQLLGEFGGILITDRWRAYEAWGVWLRQFCWAHLIRDFRGFLDRGRQAAEVGQALLEEAQLMFSLWHRVREGTLARSTFRVMLTDIRKRVRRHLREGARCKNKKAGGVCRELLEFFPALWTFARVPGVEPTNNFGERQIRPPVLYRKGSFGTHSARGSRFIERLFTAVATLRQQKRNVLEYLTAACKAHILARRSPSLLPGRLAHAAG